MPAVDNINNNNNTIVMATPARFDDHVAGLLTCALALTAVLTSLWLGCGQ